MTNIPVRKIITPPQTEMDAEAVALLLNDVHEVIKKQFSRPDYNRMRVFEMLNALGLATGTILAGCNPDTEDIRFWFDDIVTETITGARTIKPRA